MSSCLKYAPSTVQHVMDIIATFKWKLALVYLADAAIFLRFLEEQPDPANCTGATVNSWRIIETEEIVLQVASNIWVTK